MLKFTAFAMAVGCAMVPYAPAASAANAARTIHIPRMRTAPAITLHLLQIKALQHAYRLFVQRPAALAPRALQTKILASTRASYRQPVYLGTRSGLSLRRVGGIYPPGTRRSARFCVE